MNQYHSSSGNNGQIYYCYYFHLNAVHIFHLVSLFSITANNLALSHRYKQPNNNAHQCTFLHWIRWVCVCVIFFFLFRLQFIRRIESSSNSNVFAIHTYACMYSQVLYCFDPNFFFIYTFDWPPDVCACVCVAYPSSSFCPSLCYGHLYDFRPHTQ